MSNSTLLKTLLHGSIADAVYEQITSRTGRYYYFIGNVLDWEDIENPPFPINNPKYEKETRKNIIMAKEIQPGDVSFVVNRINWEPDNVYDMYDDEYSDQVIGLNLLEGGDNYTANTTIDISGGGGTGAKGHVIVSNGNIVGVVLDEGGFDYTTEPTVTIQDSLGTGGVIEGVINYAASGTNKIEAARFYVMNDEFNLYKCLDNNNNSISLVKPTDINPEPFVLSDGYKWKYIGTIPVSLRNKFVTEFSIPIINSLSKQFYSSGEIKNVNVLSTGNNYSYAHIVVQGDGHLEAEPYLISNHVIVNPGSGYTTANLNIDPPFSGGFNWQPEIFQTVGKILIHENNYYRVVQAGITASFPPVHTVGIAQNGDCGLKFIGTAITANVSLSGGLITGITDLSGSVRDVSITNGGSGYINPPDITFTGDGSNASAYAVVTDGTVSRIVFTDHGRNYTTPPTITIGTEWEENETVSINDQVFFGTRLYTVTSAGTFDSTPPTHIIGTEPNGTAELTFAGIRATGTTNLKFGSGYSRPPETTVIGNGSGGIVQFQAEKTEAIIYPYIEDGKITRVIIEDGGIGYTNVNLTVVGDGSGAELIVNLSPGDLISIQSTSELLAVDGAIHAIKVVSGGYGYTGATVTIEGDGSGATAEAEIINGKISKINVITEGSGYTEPRIIITGTGVGATARAILPPFGGHGKNIVNELFCRTLEFYTNIGNEQNQGISVNNEYRQFGIMKDIENYSDNRFFTGATGSSLWLLSGNVNINNFIPDDMVTRLSDGSRFMIVATTPNSMLVIPYDGKEPVVNDKLINISNDEFQVLGVNPPDIQKYSGQLLYIDNRLAFNITEEQAISLKTVLTY